MIYKRCLKYTPDALLLQTRKRKIVVFALFVMGMVFFMQPDILWFYFILILCLLLFKFIRSLKLNYFLEVTVSCVTVLTYVIIIRLFVFDLYKVPSESMENALYVDDKIIINKLKYGPRLPQGIIDIPWLNTFSHHNSEGRNSPYFRLSGTSQIQSNDIVVFKKSKNSDIFLVKRCVGLPGQYIQLQKDTLYINHKPIVAVETIKNRYTLSFKGLEHFIKYAKQNKITYDNSNEDGSIDTYLSAKQALLVKNMIGFQKMDYVPIGWKFFCDKSKSLRHKSLPKWTVDKFGSVLIPTKGLTINLNTHNIFLYSDLITNENNSFKLINKSIYQFNRLINRYTFTKNYFFFLGDNRYRSYDSRYWGFVSEEQIEGKVIFSFH